MTQPSGDTGHGESTDLGHAQFEKVLATAPIAYFLHDASNVVRVMNVRAMSLFGIESFDGKTDLTTQISDTSINLLAYHLQRITIAKGTSSVELTLRKRRDAQGSVQPIVLAETSVLDSGLYQTVMVDITAQKQTEQQRMQFEDKIRQSQKLEILYQLSGGIAHDFNNLLQVLKIQSDLALTLAGDDNDAGKESIKQICKSVKRGSELTKRLLAFSRKSPLTKERTDLNAIVQNSLSIIGTAIGKTAKLSIEASSEPIGVWVDPVQIEQLLMNLCLNARDATENNGQLTIQTLTINQSAPAKKSGLDLFVGPYAKLLVTDNGSGIPDSIRDSIFEPFSTTKSAGQGTGLGLAIVHNILRQHEGAIEVVESSANGTTIAVYLPMFALKKITSQNNENEISPENTIASRFKVALVADDEAAIRLALGHALEANGVSVLTASNGVEAIQLMNEHPEIELVLSDVVMPSKGGLEICEHYRRKNSSGTVILMSGHGESVLDQDYLIRFDARFLQKPFSVATLERMLLEDLHMTENRHSTVV